ncbi:unnamed protein product [Phytophthora fragariaefolia]|uniref:Unnamed protein product n=1 Tax=Phytophthora fragariaefolia TaxID=1490495 RepID=A0A9W6XM99_9STRA|nr:unnamed protein product [Phytophthora fragariaefolia]
MVVSVGDVASVLTLTKDLCSGIKQSRDECKRVQQRLKAILDNIWKMEKEFKHLPSQNFFEEFKNTVKEFQRLLAARQDKHGLRVLIEHRDMLKELARIDLSINGLFQMLGLNSAGMVADIHRATNKNARTLENIEHNTYDYSRIIANVQERIDNNFLAIAGIQQTTHDIAINLQKLHNKYDLQLNCQSLREGTARPGQTTVTHLHGRKLPEKKPHRGKPAVFQSKQQGEKLPGGKISLTGALLADISPAWFVRAADIEYEEKDFGHGMLGTVHRGVLHGTTQVVVKFLHHQNQERVKNSCSKEKLVRDISVWYLMDHRFVLKLVGASHVDSPPFIICSEAINGNLASYSMSQSEDNRGHVW